MELTPYEGVQLKSGPARNLVRMKKVIVFIPKTSVASTKQEVLMGLRNQNTLDMENWAIIGGSEKPEGQWIVMHVDEASMNKLKALNMRPYLGCDRVTVKK